MRTFLLVGWLMIAACGSSNSNKQEETKLVETQQDGLVLLDLNGEALQTYTGKTLILNLWATWCKPCIEEMPSLERMAKQLPENAVLILASDESVERILAFKNARMFDLSFAQLKTNLDALGVYSLPTTLIISPSGEIRQTIVGAREWDSPEQLAQLLTYLNEK